MTDEEGFAEFQELPLGHYILEVIAFRASRDHVKGVVIASPGDRKTVVFGGGLSVTVITGHSDQHWPGLTFLTFGDYSSILCPTASPILILRFAHNTNNFP